MAGTTVWAIVFALIASMTFSPAGKAQSLPERPYVYSHRAWQLQDFNWDSVERSITRAERWGINHVQLSHNIIMEAQELWEGPDHEKRLAFLRRTIAFAHSHGLKAEVWTHELSGVPHSFMNAGTCRLSPQLWDWVETKYNRFFKLLPEADGLVLSLTETQCSLVEGNRPGALSELLNRLLQVCRKHRKQLIVRTFSYEPSDLRLIQEALRRIGGISKPAEMPLLIMSKIVPHDWSPYYPYNPALGEVGGLPQIVELDLGQEFTGQNRFPYAQIGYIKRALDYARGKGAAGAVARIERYGASALETPNEMNLFAFSRLLQDPAAPEDEIWLEWAGATYGKPAAAYVIEALRPTFAIINLTYFPLGQWIADHSGVPSWDYAYSHIRSRQTFKWAKSPIEELRRDELLNPTEETIIKIAKEKELAESLLKLAGEKLMQARPFLSREAAERLGSYFDALGNEIQKFKHHNLAFFGILALERSCRSGMPSSELILESRDAIAEHIAKLEMAAPDLRMIAEELRVHLREVERCRASLPSSGEAAP